MISIVIPCYNEEKRIGTTLKKIISYMGSKKHDYEIIIVDDGSTDSTVNVAEKYSARVIKNKKNSGKGFSVRNGILNSKGDLILFSDADLSTPIEELDIFLKEIKRYDIVIGSRKAKGAKIDEKQSNLRIMAGNIFPILVRLLLLPGIKDSQCGFKLFRKNCLKIFKKQTIMGWAFDVEILFLAKKYDYKVKEIGITWNNDPSSKVKLIKDSFMMLIEILKIKSNNFLRKYG